MPDFLVLKQIADPPQGQASDWTPVLIAREVESEEDAARQGYEGEGSYKVLPWEEDIEVVAGPPGPPELKTVSRRALAEAAAEEASPMESAP